MLDNVTVSLKAAELASSTVALLSSMHVDFPELHASVALGLGFFKTSWGWVSSKPAARPKAPVIAFRSTDAQVAIPVKAVEQEREPWDPTSPRDVSRCKALLLEVLRRAAHDWVLYRQHHKLQLRELAEDAYTWLFQEEPGHPYWKQRAIFEFEFEEGPIQGVRSITSFLAICEALDLDPESVRDHVKKLDVRSIIASGRPAESRKPQPVDAVAVDEHGLSVNIDVDVMTSDKDFVTEYESLGTISTPSSLFYGELPEHY